MKIEASALQLSASHEASQSRSLSAESRITFRQMLGGLAEEKTETDLHERVRKLLESLIERIIAALEGRTVREQNPLFDTAATTPSETPVGPGKDSGGREIHWQTSVCETDGRPAQCPRSGCTDRTRPHHQGRSRADVRRRHPADPVAPGLPDDRARRGHPGRVSKQMSPSK